MKCLGLAAVIYIDVIQVLIMLGGSSVLLYKGEHVIKILIKTWILIN